MRATKSKASLRATGPVRAKSVKKPMSAKGKHAVVYVTKVRVHGRVVAARPSVKTRTSLLGMKIYPASVEPSDRVKPILKHLTNKSSAA
jgi:hypothetical protein